MAKKQPTDALLRQLREFGLTYPGAHTKSPWPGHLDLAVNDKTFAYLSVEGDPLKVSCKLPASGEVALMMPFCEPTAYGLGKSGWVSARFPPDGPLPELAMLKAWVDESYRAQAPKKLVAQLDALGSSPGAARPTRGAASKGAAKKSASRARATEVPARAAKASPAAKRATKAGAAKTKTKTKTKAGPRGTRKPARV